MLVSDRQAQRVYQDISKDPDKCNVYALYSLFASDAEKTEMAGRYREGGFGYGDAKKALFEIMKDRLGPLRERREELERDPGYVESVLATGAERARAEARKTLDAARQAMGL